MPKKAPVVAKAREAWHVRARAAAFSHPGLSATAGISMLIAVIVLLGEMRPGLEWLADRWQSPEQTKRQLEEVRRETLLADDKIRLEQEKHSKSDDRRAAWSSYGVADLKVTIIKNRVRDCQEKLRLAHGQTVLENCDDYVTEYKEAYDRAQTIYKAAMEASK